MTKPSLRIAVAEDEALTLRYYREIIPQFGHEVVAAALTAAEFIKQCRSTRPDMIISDIKLPDMDGLDAIREIFQDRVVPVIVVSGYAEPELMAKAEAERVFTYLVKPIDSVQLGAAITVALRRFEEYQAVLEECGDVAEALQRRKVVERAKAHLMRTANIDELAASTRLQETARDQKQSLVTVASVVAQADGVAN